MNIANIPLPCFYCNYFQIRDIWFYMDVLNQNFSEGMVLVQNTQLPFIWQCSAFPKSYRGVYNFIGIPQLPFPSVDSAVLFKIFKRGVCLFDSFSNSSISLYTTSSGGCMVFLFLFLCFFLVGGVVLFLFVFFFSWITNSCSNDSVMIYNIFIFQRVLRVLLYILFCFVVFFFKWNYPITFQLTVLFFTIYSRVVWFLCGTA